MYFLLHHSTGALVLAAEDRDQAVSWADQQLGHSAKIASVVEWDASLSSDWVERTGSGIQQTLSIGCEAQLSFMADSVQRVNGFGRELIEIEDWYRTADLSGSRVQMH
jgi:hypothetical protein